MQNLENTVTYPSRIWNADSNTFDTNVNNAISSDQVTTVGVKDTNEVLGFRDGTPIDVMEKAINSDLNGSIHKAPPDNMYQKYIQEPLAKLGMSAFQPSFITDIKPTPERAFVTSFARGATADIIKPDFSDREAKAFPLPALAGGLAGTVASYASLIGPAIDSLFAGKTAVEGVQAASKLSGLTPFAENIVKGGLGGGVYRAISDTSNQLRDSDHPDLAKIGEGVLHDTLWWGGISGLSGAASKPVGVAVSAGLGYLMAKSDGASEQDALLNGGILGGVALFHAHGEQQDVRELVAKNIESNISDYVQAKNPLVAEPVAQQTGRELVANHAEDVINDAKMDLVNKVNGLPVTGIDTPKAKEIMAKTSPPEKPFTDPYDPKMLDFLSQYISPHVIVRMDSTDRLTLANSPVKDLEAYASHHSELAQEDIQQQLSDNKPVDVQSFENEGGALNAVKEVTSSKELTKKLVDKVAKQVFVVDDSKTPEKALSLAQGDTTSDKTGVSKAEVLRAAPAESVLSYVDANGKKVHTTISNNELINLRDEVAKIPKQADGRNQLHLDFNTENLKKESTEVSREEFIKNYPPAGEMLKNIPEFKMPKVAKASSDINKSLVEKGFNELSKEEQASFDSITKKDQLEKVSEILKDYEKAKRMALGKEEIPNDVNRQVLFNAVKNRALLERDGALAKELANSPIAKERSIAAQTLSASGFNNVEASLDPVNIIQDITKTKEKSAEKNLRGKKPEQVKKDIKKSLQEKIKKAKPTKKNWDTFLDEISC